MSPYRHSAQDDGVAGAVVAGFFMTLGLAWPALNLHYSAL
jgi:hypothetical protein